MEAKLAQFAAQQLVKTMMTDPSLSPELKRILEDLMSGKLKTLQHRKKLVPEACGALLEISGADGTCDFLTFEDAKGDVRFLLFL